MGARIAILPAVVALCAPCVPGDEVPHAQQLADEIRRRFECPDLAGWLDVTTEDAARLTDTSLRVVTVYACWIPDETDQVALSLDLARFLGADPYATDRIKDQELVRHTHDRSWSVACKDDTHLGIELQNHRGVAVLFTALER